MYKQIKILEKYISASERNKSSHWKLLLNNKKVKNIYVNLGFGSFEKKYIIRMIFHYILSRLLFGFKIFRTLEGKIYSEIFSKMNRQIDNDAIRHIFIFNLLKKYIKPKKICVIGDGKANFILGALKIFPKCQIYSVNLAEVLIHDCLIINKFKVLKENLIKVVKKKEDIKKKNIKIFLVPSTNKNFLTNTDIDLFVNVASFQEMNEYEIEKYFQIIKSNNSNFYICNSPWNTAKFKFYENCKWYQYYYTFRYPFFRKYDGNIKHCYGFFKK